MHKMLYLIVLVALIVNLPQDFAAEIESGQEGLFSHVASGGKLISTKVDGGSRRVDRVRRGVAIHEENEMEMAKAEQAAAHKQTASGKAETEKAKIEIDKANKATANMMKDHNKNIAKALSKSSMSGKDDKDDD